MKRYMVLTVLGLLLLSPTFASAAIEYAGPPGGDPAYYYGGSGTAGTEFLSNITATVIKLGIYDEGSNGLSQSHDVRVWDLSGNVIASANIPSGTGALLQDGYRWVTATGTIVDGTTYVIGAYYSNDSSDWMRTQAVIDPNFTLIQDRYLDSATIQLPTQTYFNNPNLGWFGPNLQAIPEPASIIVWSLFGLGSMFGLRVWRRRGIEVSVAPARRQSWSNESRMAIHQIIEKGCRH